MERLVHIKLIVVTSPWMENYLLRLVTITRYVLGDPTLIMKLSLLSNIVTFSDLFRENFVY